MVMAWSLRYKQKVVTGEELNIVLRWERIENRLFRYATVLFSQGEKILRYIA